MTTAAPPRSPRVVDITQWYSPTSGGIRTYLHHKADWAERNGVPHAAVVPGAGAGTSRVASSDFVAVRGRTPSRGWGYRVIPRPGPVLDALRALDPDVVVIHDALAFPRSISAWAAERGVGLAMLCHSDLALAASGLPRGTRRPAAGVLGAVQHRALREAPLVLVASSATRARVAGHTPGEVVVSPLGVDAGPFREARPDAVLRRALAPAGHALLLYAGRLSSEKGLELLPAALAKVRRPATMVIAGSGAAERRLRRLAARHGVEGRMRFMGHIASRPDLAALMATADCFVHPNPTEPFGLCPIEAFAAGCRVVAARGSGTAEVLGPRGAQLVAPGDARGLAEGVERALDRPRPRDTLADLTWDATFTREWALYARLGAVRCA